MKRSRFRKPRHPQAQIEVHGEAFEVDAAIGPLVIALSELPEIFTTLSCECAEDDGLAWVAFDSDTGYGRGDLMNVLSSLQKRLRRSSCEGVLSLPTDVAPIGEPRCDPRQIEELSSRIYRFAADRRR
jgi:hypothetical protein